MIKLSHSTLFILISLLSSCSKDEDPKTLCSPAVSMNCPIQFCANFNGQETKIIAGMQLGERNETTGYRAFTTQNWYQNPDYVFISNTLQFWDNSGDSSTDLRVAMVTVGDLQLPIGFSHEEFVEQLKAAEFRYIPQVGGTGPNYVSIDHEYYTTRLGQAYPDEDLSSSIFTVDEARLYQHEGEAQVRFMASFKTTILNTYSEELIELKAGRLVGVIRIPAFE